MTVTTPTTITYTRDFLALRSWEPSFLRQFHGLRARVTLNGSVHTGIVRSNARRLVLRLDHAIQDFDGAPMRHLTLISRRYNNGYMHGLETLEVLR